jgi:hypothetical protein
MTRTFTQVPPDSTGDKLAMRSYTVGSHELHSQGVYFDGLPTYGVINDNSALVIDKYHLYLRNDAGSNQTVWITSLCAIPVNLTRYFIYGARVNFFRVTGTPTMTSLTPFPFNTADPALTGVTAGHTVTAGLTDGQLIFRYVWSTDGHSNGATSQTPIVDFLNRFGPTHPHMRPFALRPGEAVALKQINTVDSNVLYTVLMHFSVEPD